MSTGDPPILNPNTSSGVTIVNPGSGYTTGCATTSYVLSAGGAGMSYSIPSVTASTAPYWSGTQVLNTTSPLHAPDVVLDGVSMKETLKAIQDRLAILVPDLEKHEKYAALKAAYEHYKTLEALIGDGDNLTKKNEE